METSATSEKRRYRRFDVDLPVKYNSRAYFLPKYGRALNASEGGLLVHLPEELAIGHRLALKLFLHSNSEPDVISPSVEVVWTGIHMRKNFTWDYPTGVRFVEVPAKDMVKFRNFLTGFAKKAVRPS